MTRYRWTMCLPGRVVSKVTSPTFACVVLCSSMSRWQSWLIGGHSANRIRPAVIPALFCHCCSVYKRSADCGVLTDWSSQPEWVGARDSDAYGGKGQRLTQSHQPGGCPVSSSVWGVSWALPSYPTPWNLPSSGHRLVVGCSLVNERSQRAA